MAAAALGRSASKRGMSVPKQWTERTLADVCEVITDGTHFTPHYVPHGVAFYSVENVTANDFRNVKCISQEEHRDLIKRCRPQRGDILMTRIGSLGETKLLDWDVDASIYVSLALLRPGRDIDPRYLYAYTKSERFTRDVEDRSLLWASPKKINMGDIGGVPVVFPVARAEQEAIAAVLFDAEELLGRLDALFAKKTAIKQGMMQRLLTGRTRLPGFTESWTKVLLGEHVQFLRTVPLSRAQLDNESPTRCLHYGDIHTNSAVRLHAADALMPRASGSLAGRAGRLEVGDLVFADASEDPTGVGKSVEIASVPAAGVVAGLHTIAARFDKNILADGFKAYLQFIPEFRTALLRVAAGTKVLSTTRSNISRIPLILPPVDEQCAVAKVLEDADAELTALRERADKARAVKQGMMQELLTGRTRLPALEIAI